MGIGIDFNRFFIADRGLVFTHRYTHYYDSGNFRYVYAMVDFRTTGGTLRDPLQTANILFIT